MQEAFILQCGRSRIYAARRCKADGRLREGCGPGMPGPYKGRWVPYNPFTSAISCSTASSFVAQLVHTRTAVWCLSGLPMWVMA